MYVLHQINKIINNKGWRTKRANRYGGKGVNYDKRTTSNNQQKQNPAPLFKNNGASEKGNKRKQYWRYVAHFQE